MCIPPLLRAAYRPIEPALQLTDQELSERVLRGFPLPIPGFVLSGKRLRPAALLLAARAFGDGHRRAAILAAGIELIHASSLVHDDVVDHSRFRRNMTALHEQYGSHFAVLAGDYLFTRGLQAIQEAGNSEILEETLNAVAEMVEGEVEEEVLEPEVQLQEPVYLRIIEKKTASLFRCATTVGALYRGLEGEELELYRRIGLAYGMAYQIVDDCHDLFSDEDPDAEEKKITLPTIRAFQKGLLTSWEDTEPLDRLKQAILEAGGFEYSGARAEAYIQQGLDLVRRISDPDLREALENFFEYLRQKNQALIQQFS